MRIFPARFWLALLTCAVIIVPALTTVALAARRPPPLPGAPGERPPELAATAIMIDAATWDDPGWQEHMRHLLAHDGARYLLLDAQRPAPPNTPLTADRQPPAIAPARAMPGGPALGMGPRGQGAGPPAPPWYATDTWRIPLAQLAALLSIVAAMFLFVSRAFLQPLARLVTAMQQIGAGNLDLVLPRSRVREVDQAAQAFSAMAADLRQSLERQEALEQERRMTISAVAHDLRTPLFSLRGYLEGLATGLADTPDKAARYVRICRDKADALEHLVADLFSYTRTEYLEEAPRYAPLDLAHLLRRLAEGLEPQAAAKGVHLRNAAGAPAPIVGDAALLLRALENVLDNAIRHTPANGEVIIACTAGGGRVSVTIRDTGDGIAAHDLPHVFTPLYRGESSRNRQRGGAGLGLAIAQRLVRAHGGDITASNAPGGGALFVCTLPSAPGATSP